MYFKKSIAFEIERLHDGDCSGLMRLGPGLTCGIIKIATTYSEWVVSGSKRIGVKES